MGWMSCKNCIYFKACKEWASKVGDKAIGSHTVNLIQNPVIYTYHRKNTNITLQRNLQMK